MLLTHKKPGPYSFNPGSTNHSHAQVKYPLQNFVPLSSANRKLFDQKDRTSRTDLVVIQIAIIIKLLVPKD